MKFKSKDAANRQLAARERELIYGVHSAGAAIANTARVIHNVWVTRNMADRFAASLSARQISPMVVQPGEIDRRTGGNAVHQGIAVEASPLPQVQLDDISASGTVVLLDQVTDPHNVGAILRTCAAFGVSALITTSRHSPEGSGVLAKAASGGLEHVPYIKVTNLARAMEELKSMGFCLLGLDSAAEHSIEQITVPGPYAIVLGAEGKGLRRLTRTNCDVMARLDLPGALVSLNVSNAAALALYALSRRV